MQTFALLIIAAASIWLMAVAILMAVRPSYCLCLLERMTAALEASNRRLHTSEQGLRVVVGAALIIRSPVSKLPPALELVGWLLVVTSLLIMVAPPRWHGAYGAWWAGRITPSIIRLLCPVPAVASAGLIYAAI